VIDEHEPLSFRGRALPPRFTRAETAVAPGATRAYVEADWRDALVVVEEGEVELECLGGSRRTFCRGDVLCLAGLPLRALHNRGDVPAVLVAVARARGDEFRGDPQSSVQCDAKEGHADDNE
jgi:hypothetical protein